MNILDIINLVLIFIISYPYIGYPMFLYLLNIIIKRRPNHKPTSHFQPVTIIMIIHNEESRIIRKLNNILTIKYDKDKMSILIVDDHSTDRSKTEVEMFIQKNKIQLNNFEIITNKGNGKSMGINTAVEHIKKGYKPPYDKRLILLCDTRQLLDTNVLLYMVNRFQDKTVGYVSGQIKLKGTNAYGFYWMLETKIRELESDLYSTLGGIGPLSMVRLDLIPELPKDLLLDDVYIPMKVVFNGYKSVFEKDAIAYDKVYSTEDELNRKYRTLTGNFQLIRNMPELLSPKANPLFFQFFSHKVLRLLTPLFMFIIMVLSIFSTLIYNSIFGMVIFILQVAFYFLSFVTKFIKIPILSLSYEFLLFNIAPIVGLYRYLKKDYRWTGIQKDSED